MPDAWGTSKQSEVNVDPSLYSATAPTTSGQAIVTVPKHLAEASSKILVYFARVLEIPEDTEGSDKGFTEGMEFTADELEALEPIVEEVGSSTPSVIDGIVVNINPRTKEIKDVIDVRGVSHNRRPFISPRTQMNNTTGSTPIIRTASFILANSSGIIAVGLKSSPPEGKRAESRS